MERRTLPKVEALVVDSVIRLNVVVVKQDRRDMCLGMDDR